MLGAVTRHAVRLAAIASVRNVTRQRLRLHISPQRLSSQTSGLGNAAVNVQQRKLEVGRGAVDCTMDESMVTVTWADGDVARYPSAFLRDNCMCPKCRNQVSRERVINYWCVSDVGTVCTSSEITDDALTLTWNDGHTSTYSTSFLRRYQLPEDERRIVSYGAMYEREFWDVGHFEQPRFDYQEIMTSKQELLRYLRMTLKFGTSMVYNMPTNETEIFKFGDRIAYLKDTLYGPTFPVKTTDDPANVGYSPISLFLHSDQPNYSYQPEFMLLHCLAQAEEGGDSEFADAMKGAYILKEKDRAAYDVLTEVNARFDDVGTDSRGRFHVACDRPVILEDSYGEIDVVRVNDYRRGIAVNSTPEKVLQWYQAYDELKRTISQPQNIYKCKMQAGEMVTLDNRRMLHGRTGHENSPESRWLIGAFIGMDEVISKLRILEEELNGRLL